MAMSIKVHLQSYPPNKSYLFLFSLSFLLALNIVQSTVAVWVHVQLLHILSTNLDFAFKGFSFFLILNISEVAKYIQYGVSGSLIFQQEHTL